MFYCLGCQFLWTWNALLPRVLGQTVLVGLLLLCLWCRLTFLYTWGLKHPHSHSWLKSFLSTHRYNWPVPCSLDLGIQFPIGQVHLAHSTYLTHSTSDHFLPTLAPSQGLTLPTQPPQSLTHSSTQETLGHHLSISPSPLLKFNSSQRPIGNVFPLIVSQDSETKYFRNNHQFPKSRWHQRYWVEKVTSWTAVLTFCHLHFHVNFVSPH